MWRCCIQPRILPVNAFRRNHIFPTGFAYDQFACAVKIEPDMAALETFAWDMGGRLYSIGARSYRLTASKIERG
jgi:hypothetical protein